MKKFLLLILAVFTIGLFSCQDEDGGQDMAERTIVVYIAGDALQPYVAGNLSGIMEGYGEAAANGNLIVYFEDGQSEPTLYEIVKNRSGVVEKNILKTYNRDIISTDPDMMAQILEDGFADFPAKSYGLVLGSHGTSWIPGTSAPRSWGSSKEYNINIPELATVLDNIPHLHLDFVLFDACYMSAVEVAYELKDVTNYIIASPTEVLGFGFPYHSLVQLMFDYDENTIYKFGELYAEYYDGTAKNVGGYSNVMMEGSVAVIKCQGMEGLASVTRNILKDHADQVWDVSRDKVQKFYRTSSHAFAWDFAHYIKQFASEEYYALLEQELAKTIIYKYATPLFGQSLGNPFHIDLENYSGIGSFIPVYSVNDQLQLQFHNYYKELAWFKAAGWEEVWFN